MFSAGDLNGGGVLCVIYGAAAIVRGVFACLYKRHICRVRRFCFVCVYLYPETQTAVIRRLWALVAHGRKYLYFTNFYHGKIWVLFLAQKWVRFWDLFCCVPPRKHGLSPKVVKVVKVPKVESPPKVSEG
jgi:hypothetical protein